LGQTFYISLYNTDIRIALSLSHGELAAIYGTATMVGSIGVFALGRLLDRVDLRLFAGATTVAVALGCWMLARAMTIPALFLAIFIIRLTAQGLWGTTVLVSMARYFDTERGMRYFRWPAHGCSPTMTGARRGLCPAGSSFSSSCPSS
jgi:sugar phosphate permease